MVPKIIINFKTYKESTGINAIKLARLCSKFKVAIAPATPDLHAVYHKVSVPVFAQHLDPHSFGTGRITTELLKNLKIKGTLLNHSEHRLSKSIIKETLRVARKAKLITILCAKNLREVKELATLKPSAIAYEPPALIGGDISVSTAKPDIIKQAANIKVPLIVGAGIKNKNDIKIAMKLGAKGVLIASAITKAKNQRIKLNELFR